MATENDKSLPVRLAARWLITDEQQRVLLFNFNHRDDALAGQRYWATPGGGVETGETIAGAACRELREETGLLCSDPGPLVAQCTFPMQLPDGRRVLADERYFRLQISQHTLSMSGWSDNEKSVIDAHRWWSPEELLATTETIFPEQLLAMLSAPERDWPLQVSR